VNQQSYTQEQADQNNMPLASLCLITGEITIFEQDSSTVQSPTYQHSTNNKTKS
jgi:hypothetical protein